MKKHTAMMYALLLAAVGLPLQAADIPGQASPDAAGAAPVDGAAAGVVRVRVRQAKASAPAAVAAEQKGAPAPAPATVAAAADPAPAVAKEAAEETAHAADHGAAPGAAHGAAPDAHASGHAAADQDAHATAAHADPAASTSAPVASTAGLASVCEPPFKSEVAALFDRWNAALRSGDPKKVVATYAPGSVLLPTMSNRVRFTASEKEDYFAHFLKRHPEGRIDDRVIEVDCNSAVDSGIYTFRFGDGSQVRARYTFTYRRVDGDWLISSHHSSAMPEKPAPAATANGKSAATNATTATNAQTPKPWVRFP